MQLSGGAEFIPFVLGLAAPMEPTDTVTLKLLFESGWEYLVEAVRRRGLEVLELTRPQFLTRSRGWPNGRGACRSLPGASSKDNGLHSKTLLGSRDLLDGLFLLFA